MSHDSYCGMARNEQLHRLGKFHAVAAVFEIAVPFQLPDSETVELDGHLAQAFHFPYVQIKARA